MDGKRLAHLIVAGGQGYAHDSELMRDMVCDLTNALCTVEETLMRKVKEKYPVKEGKQSRHPDVNFVRDLYTELSRLYPTDIELEDIEQQGGEKAMDAMRRLESESQEIEERIEKEKF